MYKKTTLNNLQDTETVCWYHQPHQRNLPLYFFLFQSAHLAMIDTLMMAYTVETVSVEKVMACIRQYSSCNPEVETPYDTEDAVTTWINKVGTIICQCVSVCIFFLLTEEVLPQFHLACFPHASRS